MTTIAWDGRTLAADQQRSIRGTPTFGAIKIFRARRKDAEGRVLYGCAGDCADCEAVKRWVLGARKPAGLKDVEVMSIDERGRVWICDERLAWFELKVQAWAIGSGSDYALGAMEAGATATQAVRIAMKLDNATGGAVTVLRHP